MKILSNLIIAVATLSLTGPSAFARTNCAIQNYSPDPEAAQSKLKGDLANGFIDSDTLINATLFFKHVQKTLQGQKYQSIELLNAEDLTNPENKAPNPNTEAKKADFAIKIQEWEDGFIRVDAGPAEIGKDEAGHLKPNWDLSKFFQFASMGSRIMAAFPQHSVSIYCRKIVNENTGNNSENNR